MGVDYIAEYYASDNVTIGTVINIFDKKEDTYKIRIKIDNLLKGDSVNVFEIQGYYEDVFMLDSLNKIIKVSPSLNITSFNIGNKLLIYADKDTNNEYFVRTISETKLYKEIEKEELDFLNSRKNLATSKCNKFIVSESLDYKSLISIFENSLTINYSKIIIIKDTLNSIESKELNPNSRISECALLLKNNTNYDKPSITIKINKRGYIVKDNYDNIELRIIDYLRKYEPFLPPTRDGKIYNAKYKYEIEYK